MELETAFYIIGIVFMSIMLLLVAALTIAVFVIRAKIIAIHRQVEAKVDQVSSVMSKGKSIINTFNRLSKVFRH